MADNIPALAHSGYNGMVSSRKIGRKGAHYGRRHEIGNHGGADGSLILSGDKVMAHAPDCKNCRFVQECWSSVTFVPGGVIKCRGFRPITDEPFGRLVSIILLVLGLLLLIGFAYIKELYK